MKKRFGLCPTLFLWSFMSQAGQLDHSIYVYSKSNFGESSFQFQPIKEGGKPDQYRALVTLEKGKQEITIANQDKSCQYPLKEEGNLKFKDPYGVQVCQNGTISLRIFKSGDYEFVFDNSDAANPTVSVLLKPKKTSRKRTPPPVDCLKWDKQPVTVSVNDVFKDGHWIQDYYSGKKAQVKNGKVTMMPAPDSQGLMLLEKVDHKASDFSWDNATVYFLMTDRFYNGDPNNDNSFGRKKDGKDEVGTFHGGDFAGITRQLDYLKELGINALWLTPIVEQIHGFVAGGKSGSFPFYGYHGYWALDYTRVDPNWGTEEEFQTLVDEAHKRGIRVILDVVVNHVGYSNLADMQAFDYGKVYSGKLPKNWTDWEPKHGLNWRGYHQHIDYLHPTDWKKWWGPDWVRTGLPGYTKPGGDDLTLALAGLPDFLTESKKKVDLPPILKNKEDTLAVKLDQATVADYLVKWQTDWVRKFGIDGFRGDTAKHVEYELWSRLKTEAQKALDEWRAKHPEKVLDDEPFWMVGEVWDHPVFKDEYYQHGFDSLVNFEFQKQDAMRTAQCLAQADEVFQSYSDKINKDPEFNALTYISSHDTKLFFADFEDHGLQKGIAAPLLLMPGGVQIYYGDEVGRKMGPYADDMHQGTRSRMPWGEIKGEKKEVLSHWQKIANFRARHIAVGSGAHQKLSDAPYSFSRTKGKDKVIVVFAGKIEG